MLSLVQIPMRRDNYSYALIKDNQVIMIDPSDASESKAYFSNNPHLTLVAIINTHSHGDHVGGNEILFKQWHCPIYGPAAEHERIPCISRHLVHHDVISHLELNIIAYDVHAHTRGHMAYLVDAPLDMVIKQGHKRTPFNAVDLAHHRVMLVGDSLFAAGCGRLFEGTPHDLVKCLSFYNQTKADILMACAHEYTKTNLQFANLVLPNNQDILDRFASIDALMEMEGASLPCLFSLEQKTNPFLLALNEPFRSQIARQFAIDVKDLPGIIGALRTAKDHF